MSSIQSSEGTLPARQSYKEQPRIYPTSLHGFHLPHGRVVCFSLRQCSLGVLIRGASCWRDGPTFLFATELQAFLAILCVLRLLKLSSRHLPCSQDVLISASEQYRFSSISLLPILASNHPKSTTDDAQALLLDSPAFTFFSDLRRTSSGNPFTPSPLVRD